MTSHPVVQRKRIRALQGIGLLLAAPILTVNPAFSGDGSILVEVAGAVLMLICVWGRMWCTLHIGSRKNRELVTTGPYSLTRNPLYFFSTLGAMGIGLFMGSLALALALPSVVVLVLLLIANKEASHLEALFGARFRDYARATPIFFPRLSRYREPEELVISTTALRRCFLDGLLFLSVLPAIEMMEFLKNAGFLPLLFRLL